MEGVAAKQVLEEIMTKIKPAHTEEWGVMWKNRLAFALLYAALLALLTAGQLGLHMTSGSRAITRRAVAWCLGISAVLCACAVGLSGTEMPSVDRLRQSQKLIFKLISLWGIDAALGWETSAMRTRCRRLSPESTSV